MRQPKPPSKFAGGNPREMKRPDMPHIACSHVGQPSMYAAMRVRSPRTSCRIVLYRMRNRCTSMSRASPSGITPRQRVRTSACRKPFDHTVVRSSELALGSGCGRERRRIESGLRCGT